MDYRVENKNGSLDRWKSVEGPREATGFREAAFGGGQLVFLAGDLVALTSKATHLRSGRQMPRHLSHPNYQALFASGKPQRGP